MHFSSSAVALTIIGFSTALPTNTYSSGSTNDTASCLGLPECLGSSNTIRPGVVSQYEVWTGAMTRNTNGKIFKDGKTTDITTLLTFSFPVDSAGKMCSFHFDLSSDTSATVSSTGQFDVFVSLAPTTKDTMSWPSGNLRNKHLGRMQAKVGGEATWVDGFPTFGQSFLCPAGQTYGGELVGVGDVDWIEWLAGSSGPYIAY